MRSSASQPPAEGGPLIQGRQHGVAVVVSADDARVEDAFWARLPPVPDQASEAVARVHFDIRTVPRASQHRLPDPAHVGRPVYDAQNGCVRYDDRADELWLDLAQQTGLTVLVRTGGIDMGPADSTLVHGALEACRTHGLPYEHLTATEMMNRWPQFVVSPDWEACFDPQAGFLLVGFFAGPAAILKIPVNDPDNFKEVDINGVLGAVDGMLINNDGRQLAAVGFNFSAGDLGVTYLRSDDKWNTATETAFFPTGFVTPTTLTSNGNNLYVIYSYLLDFLIGTDPPVQEFTIRKVPIYSKKF